MAKLTAIDPSYAVNYFNETKFYNADETIVRNILLLLFGKPGFYPAYPRLGMYIQQYLYHFEDTFDTNSIKIILRTQCSDFTSLTTNSAFDVIKTHLSTGEPLLLFVLPTINRSESTQIVLGVTILETGEMQFNFVFNDDDYQTI